MDEHRLTWTEATLEAIRRYCSRHERNSFSRQHFIREELSNIIRESKSEGKSPSQTLSRVLQELRDENKLIFLESGKYLFIDTMVNVDETELSDRELEFLIRKSKIMISEVQTGQEKALSRRRKGQEKLRTLTLHNYNNHCALCDIDKNNLLVASHIARWSDFFEYSGRLSNVICLCKVHDPLFENGYFSFSDDYQILRRSNLQSGMLISIIENLNDFSLPTSNPPESQFLKIHRHRNGF